MGSTISAGLCEKCSCGPQIGEILLTVSLRAAQLCVSLFRVNPPEMGGEYFRVELNFGARASSTGNASGEYFRVELNYSAKLARPGM